MNLEQAATALAEQFPDNARSEIDRKEQRLERFGKIVFGGFGIVVGVAILGILYAIVTKFILAGDQPVVGSYSRSSWFLPHLPLRGSL
jgi:hypothetical protein